MNKKMLALYGLKWNPFAPQGDRVKEFVTN